MERVRSFSLGRITNRKEKGFMKRKTMLAGMVAAILGTGGYAVANNPDQRYGHEAAAIHNSSGWAGARDPLEWAPNSVSPSESYPPSDSDIVTARSFDLAPNDTGAAQFDLAAGQSAYEPPVIVASVAQEDSHPEIDASSNRFPPGFGRETLALQQQEAVPLAVAPSAQEQSPSEADVSASSERETLQESASAEASSDRESVTYYRYEPAGEVTVVQ
jgi:hypothetical protein